MSPIISPVMFRCINKLHLKKFSVLLGEFSFKFFQLNSPWMVSEKEEESAGITESFLVAILLHLCGFFSGLICYNCRKEIVCVRAKNL